MTFDALWVEVEELHMLPEAAIEQVPQILSDDTKKRRSSKTADEVGRILQDAINEINRGSVETVEALTQKKL